MLLYVLFMLKVKVKRGVGHDAEVQVDPQAEAYYVAQIKAKLKGVSCPLHGTTPYIHILPERGGYFISLENECCVSFSELCAGKLH